MIKFSKFFSKKNITKLFDDSKNAYGNFYFDLILVVLILISAFIFVAKTHQLSSDFLFFINILDYLIMTLFTLEFFLRNYLSKRKKEYFFSLYNILDILAIFPFWFTSNLSLQFLRVFRILKMFRFFGKYLDAGRVKKSIINQILIVKMASVLFILIYVSSALVYLFEHQNNEQINTFADAVYLSLVTVTTVGFGDIVPVTENGRFVIMTIILFGILLIPVYVGSLLRAYIQNSSKKYFTCKNCGHRRHAENAVHCKMCGFLLYGDHNEN